MYCGAPATPDDGGQTPGAVAEGAGDKSAADTGAYAPLSGTARFVVRPAAQPVSGPPPPAPLTPPGDPLLTPAPSGARPGENFEPVSKETPEPFLSVARLTGLLLLLCCVPVVNFILACVWAFSRNEKQRQRRNLARAALLIIVLGWVLCMAAVWWLIAWRLPLLRAIFGVRL